MKTWQNGVVGLGLILVVAITVSSYKDYQRREVSNEIKSQILQTETTLILLSKQLINDNLTGSQNGTVSTCNKKVQTAFDESFSALASLKDDSLRTAEYLYAACGFDQLDRKSLMLLQLKKQVATYEIFQEIAKTLGVNSDSPASDFPWSDLIAFETQRVELIRENVTTQGDILTLLQAGATISDPRVRTLVVSANERKETAAVVIAQMAPLRAELEAL